MNCTPTKLENVRFGSTSRISSNCGRSSRHRTGDLPEPTQTEFPVQTLVPVSPHFSGSVTRRLNMSDSARLGVHSTSSRIVCQSDRGMKSCLAALFIVPDEVF